MRKAGVIVPDIAPPDQAELHSNDTDFSRFSGLNWINPLD